jgi:sulfur carrier protein
MERTPCALGESNAGRHSHGGGGSYGFDCAGAARYADRIEASPAVLITLNGERFELERPMTMLDLLAKLDIDPRRVAIEHNLEIIRRRTFESAVVQDGDRVEIVNAVGGG